MPATPTLLTKQQYTTLLADLRAIIREGKQEAERAAAQSLLNAYWSIGRRIHTEKLTTRANFHNAILTDLSADLDIDLRTLQRTVTFYQTYRRAPTLEGLSWAHYRILMQLQDPSERAFYEELARTDALSATRLRTAIQGARYDSAQRQAKGKPIVLPRPTDPSYLYKAEVRDVIDADTTHFGGKSHDYPEEVFIVEGRLYDAAFDRWLEKGDYASRPPGELHGPFRTEEGCLVLEISFPSQAKTNPCRI